MVLRATCTKKQLYITDSQFDISFGLIQHFLYCPIQYCLLCLAASFQVLGQKLFPLFAFWLFLPRDAGNWIWASPNCLLPSKSHPIISFDVSPMITPPPFCHFFQALAYLLLLSFPFVHPSFSPQSWGILTCTLSIIYYASSFSAGIWNCHPFPSRPSALVILHYKTEMQCFCPKGMRSPTEFIHVM